MSVALKQAWTAVQFLAWAATQEERYEFDGMRPVAMTEGNANHNRITTNIHAALRSRLRGTPCSYYGPDLGVRTEGEKVRFPDALVTCSRFPGTDLIAPDVVIVFEVLSAESGRRDRIEKVREYASVASMRRYVLVESSGIGLLVLHRGRGEDAFTALSLTGEDSLRLPEIGVEIPVGEIYEALEFAAVQPPD